MWQQNSVTNIIIEPNYRLKAIKTHFKLDYKVEAGIVSLEKNLFSIHQVHIYLPPHLNLLK